jgi:carbon-monoxide dehydrogenase large subunit
MSGNGADHLPAEGRPIGRRMLRVEDRPLLTGTAEFVDDLHLEGMLHAAFLRSPLANGTIARVDLAAARSAPGVAAAFSAQDVPLGPLVTPVENPDAAALPRPLLAAGRVCFTGEPIAVVAADTPYRAEDATELIDLELEPHPAVTDAIAAISAPPIHGHHDSNVVFDQTVEAGDVDDAFEAAAVVVERTFRNPRYAAAPIEPRGVVAAPDGDGGVRIWASTQVPHSLARVTAELLGIPRESVRVNAMDVGGGFGQKAHAYPEDILVAWLALHLGRPVKWIEDRSENLTASSHARDQVVRARVAAAADGRLLALEADVVCNIGAYGVYPHGHILEALGTRTMMPGPYRVTNYRGRSRAISTNRAPEGAYRGVGMPVSAFVRERMIDIVAGELGITPAQMRRRNLVTGDEMPYTSVTNQRYDSGDFVHALDRALDHIGYESFEQERREARAAGRLLGMGICSYVEYTGMGSAVFHGRGMTAIAGSDQAWIRMDPNGEATVWTSIAAIGQGSATTFAQMAADTLGLDVDRVRVARVDTGVVLGDGTGTFASRGAVVGGGAVKMAATELHQRLLDDAAEELEADPHDLEIVDGRITVRGAPAADLDIGALVAADPERYRTNATFDPTVTTYPYATHVCKVEVDPETGGVRILRYVVAEDCGRIINPLIVEGQTHGAVAQGIGGALYESMVYDENGQPLTGSFMDYLVPTAAELPDVEVLHLEIPAPDSPNGAKGAGEGGTLGPPAAIANAVADALGVEFNELPLHPERVLTELRANVT